MYVQIQAQDVYFPMKQIALKIICGSKVMVKRVSKDHFSASFSK